MILAIDTATEMLGLALYDGYRIVWESEQYAPMRHTVELAPAVMQMLKKTGTEISTIRALGVSRGPGSFTALRIGMAFAAGFAIPRNLPVYGFPTLDILVASQPPGEGILLAVLHAGRKRVAATRYAKDGAAWKSCGAPRVYTWRQLAEDADAGATICGELDREGRDCLEKRKDLIVLPASACLRRSGILAEMTAERHNASKGPVPFPQPIYLSTISIPSSGNDTLQ